jgi:pyruvate dehydrogenase E2 component (dihydrolipoamide acetyltransferase)
VIDITMPQLSDSMEQGTILSWLKADGDHVQAGEDLVEIETDKATVTHPAQTSGVLSILASEGASLAVGAIIARLGSAADFTPPPGGGAAIVGSDASPPASSAVVMGAATATPVGGNGKGENGGARATPLARRIASVHGVALDEIHGSGPLGRITRADVLRAAGIADRRSPLPAAPEPALATGVTASPPADAPVTGAKGDVEIIEPTTLQGVVARRMAQAKATAPHFQVQTDVVMDEAIAFRARLKATHAPHVPSVNDLIVKAAALSLRAHGRANGAYRDGRFEQYGRVNVGVAVATEDALVVPTIFDADTKSLGAIAAEARRLAARVREASVTPAELSGATFTVSNLGMYGMTAITPVINPPQAAILGVGTIREVLARANGEIVDRHLMTLTLSCDHRILYGAQAAEFLCEIRDLLEHPLRLAL